MIMFALCYQGCLFLIKLKKFIWGLLLPLALAGCAEILPPMPNNELFSPVYPDDKPSNTYKQGGIYQTGSNISLYHDRVARRVGDILTIRLDEETKGKKKASNKTDKGSKVKIPIPIFFGKEKKSLEFDFGSDQNFDGSAEADQSNRLEGNITVTVIKALSNGNFVVRGESWIQINRGKEFVRLMGIVRSDDIEPNNVVSSRRVANARISYSGTGAFAGATREGFINRSFSKYFPY